MRLIFEGRPSRTFCFALVFNVGWRNEPPNRRGTVSAWLSRVEEYMKEKLPEYFEIAKRVDAEYSQLSVWGISEDASLMPEALAKAFEIPSQEFLEIGGGVLFAVASGAMKGDVLEELETMKIPGPQKNPKLFVKPRNFVKTKGLTRIETLFLYQFLKSGGEEFYLELSPTGDRIHYGKKCSMPSFSEVERFKKKFKAMLLKKIETNTGTVDLLVSLNVFQQGQVLTRDVVEGIERMNLLKKVDVLERALGRVLS